MDFFACSCGQEGHGAKGNHQAGVAVGIRAFDSGTALRTLGMTSLCISLSSGILAVSN